MSTEFAELDELDWNNLVAKQKPDPWTRDEAIELCKLIQSVSPKHHAHPALTGGLLYKDGPRKDCDIVIYQRGDTKGEKPAVDWGGFWESAKAFGLELRADHGYVKKCAWRGKEVDVFDPTADGEYLDLEFATVDAA